ncbi:hypothetical protein H5410_031623 [Solanum commersonii]|uniref:Uncharacterized protein n=1 Tax=Solanum commersonii TaxID=4109 RepID=A0A9J5YJP8_SOLCO|nr:hypothetical protein H5410_031623 [Solanum commersonii]
MDDSTLSKRTARGTPLHIQVVDNPPSFSIGLTQDFGVNAGSMTKSIQKVISNAKASDIKIVEGGSKRKAKDSDSKEIVSASSDLDKSEEHQVFA